MEYKMVDLYSAAYWKPNDRDFDHNHSHCGGGGAMSVSRKGRRGKRRYWCINRNSNRLKYSQGGGGHNPCRGVGDPHFIGGGLQQHGHQVNYSGKGRNFKNALFAVRCRGVNVTDGALRSWSGNHQTLSAGANDSRGGFKNLWTQAAFGIVTDAGSTGGYCANIANLNRVIHRNGDTCFDSIKNAAERKTRGIQFCKKYPKDKRCKCINVSGSGFVEYCKKNPTLPGCDEVVKGIKEFEKAGLKSATGLFGNADCIVPGVCSGDVFQPLSSVSACANKTAICNQVMNLDNIKAAAGVKALQGCNINFEAEQKKKDEAKKAAAAKGAAPAAKGAAPAAKGAAPAAKGAPAAPSKLPGGITGLQAGIGGGLSSFLLSCSCLLVIIIVVMMGSKRRRR
jgi:hypothetical protein